MHFHKLLKDFEAPVSDKKAIDECSDALFL